MNKIKARKLNSFSERFVGLSGSKKSKPVYFETRFGLHSFGMLSPIDVVIMDKNGKVMKIKTGLRPNRLFFWNPKYNKVLELPRGFVKKYKIAVGKKLIYYF